jgi:hypothetical protein
MNRLFGALQLAQKTALAISKIFDECLALFHIYPNHILRAN